MDDAMRDFIVMTENLIRTEFETSETVEETFVPSVPLTLLQDLVEVVFKLRAFTESEADDIGLGTEIGMQRAADMIENVINRHRQGE